MSALLARIRLFLQGLRGSTLDDEVSEEFRHHIELRTQDLMSSGLSRREARRRAHLEFGHIETHRARARSALGLGLFDRARFSWIDVKLGARMLVKNPALTVVALFALGIGIPVGLAPWQFFHAVGRPLPVEDGDGIRAMRYFDTGPTGPVARGISPYELQTWRDEITSFSELGAFRSQPFRVSTGAGAGSPVSGAEMTASSFRILRVPPLRGRTLDDADEMPGAENVVVIGHELWQARLGGEPDVVGRTIAISGIPHTVVGIMPEGFRFPTRENLWLPLREAPATGPSDGDPLRIFGRLADGITEEAAQLEADALGGRMALAFPAERENWQLEVTRFGIGASGFPNRGFLTIPAFYGAQLAALLLLVIACANVAILVLARAATRFREIAVRTALGASRMRIMSQMFAESLILTLLATGAGLLASDRLFGLLIRTVIVSDGGVAVPYWMDLGVTPDVVAAALALAALSAGIASILPALKVTGGDVHRHIQRLSSGAHGVRFGRVTGALIALDVALAVVTVGFVTLMSNRLLDLGRSEELVGVPATEYLAVQVDLTPDPSITPSDTTAIRERIALTQRVLIERIAAQPEVRAVAAADRLPRMEHPTYRIDLEGADVVAGGYEVHVVNVGVGYFEALGGRMLAGRPFDRADFEPGASPAIVNTAFVQDALGGGDALGRRFRLARAADEEVDRWHEIVGVVGPLGMNVFAEDGGDGVYLPAAPGSLTPIRLAIHLGASPEAFAPRLREIVSEVDPSATIDTPRALNRVQSADWYLGLLVQGLVSVLVLIMLSLAVSGLYAIVSFSVSQRAREIGIRTALGARRDAIALAVARRALRHVAWGGLIGTPIVVWMFTQMKSYAGLETTGVTTVILALLPGLAVLTLVAALSCTGPVLRALRLDPNQVLKAVG